MDKYVTRTTSRRASKRNFAKTNEDESELVLVYEKKSASKSRPKSKPAYKRCDSITEAENDQKQIVTRANSQKRKKLEPVLSPIKPLELLENVEETKASSSQNSNSTNENFSIYDISLDFGNKSWADIVFEEEQEKLGILPMEPEKPENCAKNDESRKEKEKTTTKNKRQTPKRLLNADGKRQASNFSKTPPSSPAASKKVPPKSSAWAEKSKKSAEKLAWRKKPLIDEDSQNTLTEAEQLKNPPPCPSSANHKRAGATADQSKSSILYDETNTQSSFTALLERPRRSTGPPVRFPCPENWVEPKNGWEEDPVILERREKDLVKGKNSDVYKEYIATIKKKDRIKGVHPKTPNKYLKVTRRSWDTQVRVWRRLLYHAVNVDVPSDVSSLASTNCSETGSEHDVSDLKLENISDIEDFDDETKTLKASEPVDGPTDFALLTTVN